MQNPRGYLVKWNVAGSKDLMEDLLGILARRVRHLRDSTFGVDLLVVQNGADRDVRDMLSIRRPSI